jgi:rhodanese-related sulfurtransferase
MLGLVFLVALLGIVIGCTTVSGNTDTGMGEVTELTQLPKNNRGYAEITANQLSPLLEGRDFLLVNVNSAATEIIPTTDFTVAFDELAENLDRFPRKDQPTVLYCQAGPLSRSAARDLVELGFTDVIWLDGGISAWKRAGFDVEKR